MEYVYAALLLHKLKKRIIKVGLFLLIVWLLNVWWFMALVIGHTALKLMLGNYVIRGINLAGPYTEDGDGWRRTKKYKSAKELKQLEEDTRILEMIREIEHTK